MRQLARRSLFAAVTAALVACTLHAQSSRDSAGVRIVENTRPLWTDSERLVLAPTPRLAFGDSVSPPYRFRQVRGVMQLSDGHIAVADGASLQLRMFSPDGRFLSASEVKGTEPGQPPGMLFVHRQRGDTIAIASDLSTLALYSQTGQFARTHTLPGTVDNRPSSLMLLAVMGNGTRIAAPLPRALPHATGTRWADSVALKLFAEPDAVVRELGAFPYLELEQVGAQPVPPWLSAIGVFVGGDDRFYAGFGDQYAIRVFAADGTLLSIIRRSWTPTPVTPDDWEQWVVEWSKLWVTSTGAERARDVQKVREEPWAEMLPAFSQFIVDRSGRLWVREAHWQDAIGAGSLTDLPAVPSAWSVFDGRGRWLGDVRMPANFQAFEIGDDYVAGKARTNGVNQVVIYSLGVRGR